MTHTQAQQAGYDAGFAGKPATPPSGLSGELRNRWIYGHKAGVEDRPRKGPFQNSSIRIGQRVQVLAPGEKNNWSESARAMDFRDGKYLVQEGDQQKWFPASQLKVWNSSSFQNGADRARQEIANKAAAKKIIDNK